MEMISVASSNVASVGYDESTLEMVVQYKNGGKYTYHGVFAEEFGYIIQADSVGKALQFVIGPRNAPIKKFTKYTEKEPSEVEVKFAELEVRVKSLEEKLKMIFGDGKK